MSTSPRHLGKYELQQQLGWGGMAEVWKAFDSQLQRYVAIKLLHANLQADPNFVTRFQREAQLIASLHHPNIVNVHDFQVVNTPDSEHPIAYMVIDYVEGQTLADYIRNTSARGQFPSPVEVVNLFTSISLAIDYAHQKGMIHRDIKPANILLDKRDTMRNRMGEPILTDFGVAKLLSVSTSALSDAQLGTPLYISPEQAQGLPGNERSDLYSIGVILYEVATGVPPFRGGTPIAVIAQHINASPPSPALINPNISPAVAAIILRSLAKDPNARFPSASAMTMELAQALNVPVPERLSAASGPINTWAFASPSQPIQQTSSRTTPAHSATGIPTVAAFEQDAPTAISSHSHPIIASVGQTPGAISGGPASAPSGPTYTPSSLPAALPPPRGKKRSPFYAIAAGILLAVVLGSGLGAYFLLSHNGLGPTPASTVVGHAFYISSGQLNPGSAQGIADEMQIDVQNIPNPAPGKSYYAWLLGDIHPVPEVNLLEPPLLFKPPLLLGRLSVSQGNVRFFYPGDAQHDNLFSVTSRLLITEESTNVTPRSPSTNRSTWRYYAEIPQTPYGQLHLSALDHIRHLFYKETKVDVLGLPGGLDIWLYRNTEKLLEWSVSARDAWQSTPTDRSQFIRILDYLDGVPNVHLDLPPNTPVLTDPIAARVALLTVSSSQGVDLATNPPGYLDHVPLHLNGVVQAPDATPQMRQLATQIIEALNNAAVWLKQVRKDAQTLFHMSNAQLMQPSTLALLDDLVTNATYAYIGRLDPATNTVQPAILQVHYDIQQLATYTITTTLPSHL